MHHLPHLHPRCHSGTPRLDLPDTPRPARTRGTVHYSTLNVLLLREVPVPGVVELSVLAAVQVLDILVLSPSLIALFVVGVGLVGAHCILRSGPKQRDHRRRGPRCPIPRRAVSRVAVQYLLEWIVVGELGGFVEVLLPVQSARAQRTAGR